MKIILRVDLSNADHVRIAYAALGAIIALSASEPVEKATKSELAASELAAFKAALKATKSELAAFPTTWPTEVAEAIAANQPDGSENTYTREDLMRLVSEKKTNHREEIRAKLNELGAERLGSLGVGAYAAMGDFMTSLS